MNQQTTPENPDRLITVCSACKCACCWHGEAYCYQYQTAGTVQMKRSELDALAYEHPCNYSDEKIKEVCGE